MSRIRLNPHSMGSKGAKELAKSLGILRLRRRNSKFKPRMDDIIINWGVKVEGDKVNSSSCNIINTPTAVARASDKLTALNMLFNVGVPVPPFTISHQEALEWLEARTDVVVRHSLSGSSGVGIEIVKRGSSDLPFAPLYTAYVPKSNEFRVHVVNGNVIDYQRKMRKRDVPDNEVNWKVRNLKGGFIFGRGGVELPPEALNIAVDAVRGLGLDFGAVDLLESKHTGEFMVLEVNTAPGLVGTTLEKYTEAFKNLLGL